MNIVFSVYDDVGQDTFYNEINLLILIAFPQDAGRIGVLTVI